MNFVSGNIVYIVYSKDDIRMLDFAAKNPDEITSR